MYRTTCRCAIVLTASSIFPTFRDAFYLQLSKHVFFYCRLLSSNKLTGSVPTQISALTSLQILDVGHNKITGSIPTMPQNLKFLALHQNQITGQLNSLSSLNSLCFLTIFGNQIRGCLNPPSMITCKNLPAKASITTDSPVLLAHNNYLSCTPKLPNASAPGILLVAPGNQLTSPEDGSASEMANAKFLWVHGTISMDHWFLLPAIAGIFGFIFFIAAALYQMRKTRGTIQHCSAELHSFERLMLSGSKCLVPICVCAAILCVSLGSAAHVYQCGDPIMRLSLAYVDLSAVPKPASLAVFFFYAANLWMVHSLRFQMGALSRKHVPSDDSTNMHGVSTRNATWKADGDVTTGTAVADSSGKITFTFAPSCNLHVSGIAICKASWGVSWPLLARISIWAAVVLICSLVPVLNTMAKYIPTTNRLSAVASAAKRPVGILMWLLNSFVFPKCARVLAASPKEAVQMLQYGRLFMNQLVTLAATIWLDEDCFGGWKGPFFEKCSNGSMYDINITGISDQPIPILHHDQICGLQEPDSSKCSRAVLENMSKLLILKLLVTAFLAPAVVLLLNMLKDGFLFRTCLVFLDMLKDRFLCRKRGRSTSECVKYEPDTGGQIMQYTIPYTAKCTDFMLQDPLGTGKAGMLVVEGLGAGKAYSYKLQSCGTGDSRSSDEGFRLGQISIDTEMVSIMMLYEMALVMGVLSPIIPLLCLCAMILHCGAFYVARVKMGARLQYDAEPDATYLLVCVALSNVAAVSYFWCNRDGAGEGATFITVSCTGLTTAYLAWAAFERSQLPPEGMMGMMEPEREEYVPPELYARHAGQEGL